MTPEEFIKRAKVGDIVHICEYAGTNAAGKSVKIIGIQRPDSEDDPDETLFVVDMTGITNDEGRQQGFILKQAHIEDLNNDDSSGYEALYTRVIIKKEVVYARWYSAENFDMLSHCDSGRCNGFNPAVIKEKDQQFQKDVNFFFKDLAEEWVSPGKNGFKFL